MSDTSALPATFVVAELQGSLTQNYMSIAASALMMYDHVLNFGDEVELIWGRKSASSILLSLNRLVLTASIITNVLSCNPLSNGPKSCSPINYAFAITYVMSICVSTVVVALRVHATSRSNWWLTVPTLALGLVPVGTNVFINSRTIDTVIPSIISNATYNALVFVTRVAPIASDMLAVIVTWWYMSHLGLPAFAGSYNMKSTLTMVMLEDGTLYFMVLTLLNVTDIIVFTYTHTNIPTLIAAVSSVLTSGFLLRIRKAADRKVHIGSQTPSFVRPGDVVPTRSWMSSIEFAPNIVVPSSGQEADEGDIVADGAGRVSMPDGDVRDEESQEDVIELEVLGGGVNQTESASVRLE